MENEELIVEETHNDDIGTADFNFNTLVKVFQELPTASLIRSVAAVVPMKMSTGQIINIKKNATTDAFETVVNTLTVNTSTSNPTQTGLSIEAVQDLQNQYGLDGYDIAANLLKGIVDQAENTAFLTFLDANALAQPVLTMTAPASSEQSLFEITQRVQELVIKMNTPNFRTFSAFAILPYKSAASISALSHYVRGSEESEKRMVLNKMGKTMYYVNPDVAATTMYVGLHETGKANVGASSVIMGTFPQMILRTTHVESFNTNMGILNRYATAMNPLSGGGFEMLMSAIIN
jgi:hypothetical protein